MFVDLAFLIPVLPALGWLFVTLFGRALAPRTAAWIATLLMAASAVLAVGLFREVSDVAPVWDAGALERHYETEHNGTAAVENGQAPATGEAGSTLARAEAEGLVQPSPLGAAFPITRQWTWLALKGQEGIPFGFYFDQLAAIMIMMVAVVATFIHLFSIGYMWGEDRYPTFFAYINLFAAAMLAMVMSKNLFHVLLFWEIMGLMSYLLIGFFYKKRSAQQAQKKAFLTVPRRE